MRNIVLATALFAAFNANANLLTNGGFEDYTEPTNFYDHLTPAELVPNLGWSVGNKLPSVAPDEVLELRHNYYGTGYGGVDSSFIELAPQAGSSIKQSFTTNEAGQYTVSWFYAQRDLTALSDETRQQAGSIFDNDDYSVWVGGVKQFQFSLDDPSYQQQYRGAFDWTEQSFTVDLFAGQTYELEFQSLTDFHVGINLDSISVVAAVPEPETYAMLLAGLALVGFTSRKRKA